MYCRLLGSRRGAVAALFGIAFYLAGGGDSSVMRAALLINPLILPVQPAVMVLGELAVPQGWFLSHWGSSPPTLSDWSWPIFLRPPVCGDLCPGPSSEDCGGCEAFTGTCDSGERHGLRLALDLGSGACLRVLAVGKRAAILLLEWGSFHTLLPVGIDFDLLEDLQADPALRDLDALLLSESGYAPANPPEWITKLHPQVVLLSVGAGDRDGRPDPETLAAAAGYPLLRTDRNGWIEMSTDGDQMWVEVERP